MHQFKLIVCLIVFISVKTMGQDRPNILLLVADDLGYSDLGCYGGEIATPNIDALASQGIQFTRFHAATMCAPSRAMFLSGNDNHVAGMGSQSLRTDFWGYEGHLSDRVMIIPEILQRVGYHTYMVGKWHLGKEEGERPTDRGFERCYANLYGTESHYDDRSLFEGRERTIYSEDGEIVERPSGVYSTDLYTDKLIEQIGSGNDDSKPFFALAAYTSPHWPLKVDSSFWMKYEGNYDDGYEALRKKRQRALIAKGLIPPDAELPPLHPKVAPWSTLTDEQKRIEARKMELYAGMVDNLDYNIGRLLTFLKETDQYDNTLIVFMSDNGAAAEDFYYNDYFGPYLQSQFTDDYASMGLPDSYVSYGPQWAEASSAPFRYFKTQGTEGGLIAPAIVTGAGVSLRNAVLSCFVTLTDLAPTFYDIAGATYPEQRDSVTLRPLLGESFRPVLEGRADVVHDENYVWATEHRAHTFVIKGDWKLLNNSSPHDPEAFELYDLSRDVSETDNLVHENLEKLQELFAEWRLYIEVNKVQFPVPRR